MYLYETIWKEKIRIIDQLQLTSVTVVLESSTSICKQIRTNKSDFLLNRWYRYRTHMFCSFYISSAKLVTTGSGNSFCGKWLPEPMMTCRHRHWCDQNLVSVPLNTFRPRYNRHHFADDIFKCIFVNESVWISLKISLKFVLKVRINNIPASHTNCDVTSCPVVMRRYANADGDEQRYKTSKTQVSLAFCKIAIEVE